MINDDYDDFLMEDRRQQQPQPQEQQQHHQITQRHVGSVGVSVQNEDVPIIQTADDAIRCKQATMSTGYYNDPFLHHMIPSSASSMSSSSSSMPHSESQNPTWNHHHHHRHRQLPQQHHQNRLQHHHHQHHHRNHHHHQQHNHFHHNHHHRPRQVQPIIKRGTYARVCVMDRAIYSFLDHVTIKRRERKAPDPTSIPSSCCQIVVLGAGKDTTYFRYLNHNLLGRPSDHTEQSTPSTTSSTQKKTATQQQQQQHQPQVRWYEIDHPSVIEEKAQLIQSSNLLSTFCPNLQPNEHGFRSSSTSSASASLSSSTAPGESSGGGEYYLIGHDLRDSPTELMKDKLQSLDPSIPTLFLMECVSMYLPVTSYQSLIHAIVSWSSSPTISSSSRMMTNGGCDVTLVAYEAMLGNEDRIRNPFGTMMEQNLQRAHVAVPGSCLLELRTLQNQLNVLIDDHSNDNNGNDNNNDTTIRGFDRAVGCDMWSAYQTVLTDEQRTHANSSEFLDEYEEFVLIMQHYSLIVATKVDSGDCTTVKKDYGDGTDDDGDNGMVGVANTGLTSIGSGSLMGFQVGRCTEKTSNRSS